jgi:hypothetical protein
MDENVVIKNQVRIWQSISYPINNSSSSAMTKLRLLVLSFPDFTDISSKSAGATVNPAAPTRTP